MRPVKAAIIAVWAGTSVLAQEQPNPPLSAIDWLNELAAMPVAQPGPNEPATTQSASTPDVDVTPLDRANSDAVGLLPSSTTGLPASLWVKSRTGDLVARLNAITTNPLPALQALYYTLLLAEADAPADVGPDSAFLVARIATLGEFGAVDPARALVERAGAQNVQLFDLWLELSLLAGTEDAPCKALRERPALSQSYAARIYCTARSGDWPTAALLYDTALGLGALESTEAVLLELFLDPEAVGETPLPQVPGDVSALMFRLYEAAGMPLPTSRLPRAFAMADLRKTAGWRAEIEAAERLARTGALPANQLLGLYTDGKPAASGGVWDRVRAIQALDAAVQAKDAATVSKTLPTTWELMRDRGLHVVFAQLFADALQQLDLTEEARAIAFHVSLLSDGYETAGKLLTDPDAKQRFLIGLARGVPDRELASTSREKAIALGFSSIRPGGEFARLIEAGKTGEAILAAATQLDGARSGNMANLTEALATLRTLGLEDTARRAALQILILGPS